jgi:uncharacterized membrane protein YcaP (DUF421 family)
MAEGGTTTRRPAVGVGTPQEGSRSTCPDLPEVVTVSLPGLQDLVRVLLVTPMAYAAVVVALRLSGPRALAKLNAFDLVVTVALGSVLAGVVTASGPGLVTGVLALVVLLALQVLLSWWTSRHPGRDGAVRADPIVLVRDGVLVEPGLLDARLTPREVHQAVRSAGFGGLDAVAVVCLETDGTVSVIGRGSIGDGSVIDGLAPTPSTPVVPRTTER